MTKTTEYCDRCGAEIKEKIYPFAKIRTKVETTTLFGHGAYDFYSQNILLCNKCNSDFDKFMKG